MLTRFLILAALFGVISACSYQEQLPFKIVQICLPDSTNVSSLKTMMQATAANEGMAFVDNTERARRGLAVTAQSRAQSDEAKWVISLIVHGSDGLGATATHLGLAPLEIAIGFTSGRSHDAAQAFAKRLIEKFSSRWKVVAVPNGRAAEKGACS